MSISITYDQQSPFPISTHYKDIFLNRFLSLILIFSWKKQKPPFPISLIWTSSILRRFHPSGPQTLVNPICELILQSNQTPHMEDKLNIMEDEYKILSTKPYWQSHYLPLRFQSSKNKTLKFKFESIDWNGRINRRRNEQQGKEN